MDSPTLLIPKTQWHYHSDNVRISTDGKTGTITATPGYTPQTLCVVGGDLYSMRPGDIPDTFTLHRHCTEKAELLEKLLCISIARTRNITGETIRNIRRLSQFAVYRRDIDSIIKIIRSTLTIIEENDKQRDYIEINQIGTEENNIGYLHKTLGDRVVKNAKLKCIDPDIQVGIYETAAAYFKLASNFPTHNALLVNTVHNLGAAGSSIVDGWLEILADHPEPYILTPEEKSIFIESPSETK